MRVTCSSLVDFLENLESVKVLDDVIRVDISRQQSPGNPVFTVVFQASAVVDFESGDGQYLLQVGVVTGKDYEDATKENEGSDEAKLMKGILSEFCEVRGWKVKPGVIEI